MARRENEHTMLIILPGQPCMGQGTDVGEDDDRGVVIVDTAVVCCRLLAWGGEWACLGIMVMATAATVVVVVVVCSPLGSLANPE